MTLGPAPRGLGGSTTLSDGRELTYETYGAVVGPTVLLLDGSGSRLQARVAGAVAADLGVHLVSVNRPGFHGSTPAPGRTIASTAVDLVEAMDRLGIDHTGVLALSAGTPFAIGLALAAPTRVSRLSLVGPVAPPSDPWSRWRMAPVSRVGFYLGRHSPSTLAWMYRRMGRLAERDVERVARMLVQARPLADQQVMTREDVWPLVLESVPDLLTGPESAAWEMALIARPWDVDPAEVTTPTSLWSGPDDDVHPTEMAQALAQQMPDATLHLLPGAMFDYLDRCEELLLDVTGKSS